MAMAISAAVSAVALVCTLLIRETRHIAPEEQPGAPAGGDTRTGDARLAGVGEDVQVAGPPTGRRVATARWGK